MSADETGRVDWLPERMQRWLPAQQIRPLPPPISVRKMIGPSIILAGLSLGSGEFVIWPYITHHRQFVFFWACLVGVTMQYILNMEITRWTLATGETAVTGFVRINRHFAWLLLLMNFLPWMLPAWAKGAAQIASWLVWDTSTADAADAIRYLAMGGLLLCGLCLTLGPVVYDTIERMQLWLVASVMVLVVLLAVWLGWDRPDAVAAQCRSVISPGLPEIDVQHGITFSVLLGALAFAGCGGTLNLAQSDYVKDKGYGMGRYIGRITSPLTGQSEAEHEVGYAFATDDESNMRHWRGWWRSASIEHFFSFFLTCVICLSLLSLISYILSYDASGNRIADVQEYGKGMDFIRGEAEAIRTQLGPTARWLFLVTGIAILFTTELGVLDAVSRIGMGLAKVAYLRDSTHWSASRLYVLFLWLFILSGCLFLWFESSGDSFPLLKRASALNGVVMFLYSGALIYLNRYVLPRPLRMSGARLLGMWGVVLFFGFFTLCAGWELLRSLAEPAGAT